MALGVEAPAREDLSFRDNDDKLVGVRWLKSDGLTPVVIVTAELALKFDPAQSPDPAPPPDRHEINSTTPGNPTGWIDETRFADGIVLVNVPHGIWATHATRSGHWDLVAISDTGIQRCIARGVFLVDDGEATP